MFSTATCDILQLPFCHWARNHGCSWIPQRLLEVVRTSTGSQWAAQVSESIELSLTYGLVISALLFLSLVALLRFFVPWQRVWGLIESMTNKTPEPVKEKEF